MLRFISIALILLLCTAPGFFSQELFVVESLSDDLIKLESLALIENQSVIFYCKRKTFHQAKEGQLVCAHFAGNYLVKLEAMAQATDERTILVSELLQNLMNNTNN